MVWALVLPYLDTIILISETISNLKKLQRSELLNYWKEKYISFVLWMLKLFLIYIIKTKLHSKLYMSPVSVEVLRYTEIYIKGII